MAAAAAAIGQSAAVEVWVAVDEVGSPVFTSRCAVSSLGHCCQHVVPPALPITSDCSTLATNHNVGSVT